MLLSKLLAQSQHPEGWLGKIMMKLWNRAYFPMVKWSLGFVRTPQNGTILDVGVGNGLTTKYISDSASSSLVTGIDISETAITAARKKNTADNLSFFVTDVEDLPFPNHNFDLITAFQTHFHWNSYVRGLEEIYRVLKYNGQVIIACEKVKLNYFMSGDKNGEYTKRIAKNIGFTKLNTHYYQGWLYYHFTK
ncbi:class I SAM-dependent methyltransferase [Sporolactobacillus shoreicorticis]|uniref:Class I SAM-dependent methyltransferase n=1 Tax=Sporolactobacillus shoreicorticis TaxID=1923877 RepID=A0ABW5S3X4_9BACL|nr:class I SAM-dependent methyltransferase [Sporolactobacillus shoreicorticis]MCO7127572.1 class I SAM-dependent methyltransferase [Sporolactobacillus shoreicorticis]